MGVDEGNLQVIDVDVTPRPSEHPPVRGGKCQNA